MATQTAPTETEEQKNLAEAKRNLAEARRRFAEAKKAAQKRKKRKHDTQRRSNELDDARLLESSRMWHAIFLDHVPAFSGFDASLNNAYAATWLNKIDAFEALDTDETILDQLQQDTKDLDSSIMLLLDKIADLEYFVKRAWPNNERKLMEFAFAAFPKIVPNRVGHLALQSLTAIRVIAFYAAPLAAAGMPAALPTDIEDAVSAMVLAETTQEFTKRVRIRTATERVLMFNGLWDIHIALRDAAKIVFRDKPAVAGQFT